MRNLLDDFLEPLVTPERREVIVDCVVTLEEMNYEAALDELSNIIQLSDETETVNLLGRIEAVLDVAQEHFINTYGIVLLPGLSQYQKQYIVKCLTNLDHYILPDQIELLLMGDFDNPTVLAKLVELLEGIEAEELLPFIHTVPDSFMTYLKDMTREQLMLRGSMEDYTVPVSRIRLINMLFAAYGKEPFSLALELIQSGKRIGSALRPLIDDHIETLDNYPIDVLPYQLIGLVVISDVATDTLDRAITDEILAFTDNAYERKLMIEALNKVRLTLLKSIEA